MLIRHGSWVIARTVVVFLFVELDIQSCRQVDSSHFMELSKLTKLQSLNLYRTVIDLHSLVAIVRLLYSMSLTC